MGVSGSEPSVNGYWPEKPKGEGRLRPPTWRSSMMSMMIAPPILPMLMPVESRHDIMVIRTLGSMPPDLWAVTSRVAGRRHAMDFGYRVKSPVGIPLGLTLVLSRTYPVAPAVTPIPGWIMASTGEGPLKERSLGTVATMPNPPLVGPLVAEELIPSVALAVT